MMIVKGTADETIERIGGFGLAGNQKSGAADFRAIGVEMRRPRLDVVRNAIVIDESHHTIC